MAKLKKELTIGSNNRESFGVFEAQKAHYNGIKFEVIGAVKQAYWNGNQLNQIDLTIKNQGLVSKFNFFHANFCNNKKKLQIHVAFGNCLKDGDPIFEQEVTETVNLDPGKAPSDKTCLVTTDCFDVELLAYYYHPTNKKEDLFYKECNKGSAIQITEYDLTKCPRVDEDSSSLALKSIKVDPETQNGNIIVGKN